MPFSLLITRSALPINILYGNQEEKEIRKFGGTHQILLVMLSLFVLMTAAISSWTDMDIISALKILPISNSGCGWESAAWKSEWRKAQEESGMTIWDDHDLIPTAETNLWIQVWGRGHGTKRSVQHNNISF